jgi:hypothetical protein
VDAIASLRRSRGVENTAADVLMGFGLLWRLREARALTSGGALQRNDTRQLRASRRALRLARGSRAPQPSPVVMLRDEGELHALGRLAAWANIAYATSIEAAIADAPAGARILAGPFEATDVLPAFLVGHDINLNAIVVAVRGSQGWSEALISLQAVPVAVAGGTAHAGMLSAADALVARLRAGAGSALPPLATLLSNAVPGTSLVLTGHSLGAAVAALAALRLQTATTSPTTAVTFCAPPCVSPAVARSMRAYVTSAVHGDDAVPRMHLHAIRRLRAELSTVDWAAEFMRAAAPPALAAPAAAALRGIGRGLAAFGRALPRGSRTATLNVIDTARRVAAFTRPAVDSVLSFLRSRTPEATATLSDSASTGSALAAAAAATTLIKESPLFSRSIFPQHAAVARTPVTAAFSAKGGEVDARRQGSADGADDICAYGGELDAAAAVSVTMAASEFLRAPFAFDDLVHTVAGQIVWFAYPGSRRRGPLPLLLRERTRETAPSLHALPPALSSLRFTYREHSLGRRKLVWTRKSVREALRRIAKRMRATALKSALLDKVATEAESPANPAPTIFREQWPFKPLQLLRITPYTFRDHPISNVLAAIKKTYSKRF